jgi:acetyl-CoA acetyltransferase
VRELELNPAGVDPNGDAIALGHPLGCLGARIVAMLVWEMGRRGARHGLGHAVRGVGQGVALVLENPAAA